MSEARNLNVFLCHSSQDKPIVRKMYQRLLKYKNLEPWLDEKKILPGQNWDLEIRKALRTSDAIIICLSNNSITKEGYIQKEIKLALDIAAEKPEGVIFLIPLLIEQCKVPESLTAHQWVNYYENIEDNHDLLIKALQHRGKTLDIHLTEYEYYDHYATPNEPKDLYKFIEIPEDDNLGYPFWVSKYPVTNVQYERFLSSDDFSSDEYWTDFPLYDRQCQPVGKLTKDELGFYSKGIKKAPSYWNREDLGQKRKFAPVVGVNWFGANAYSKWLIRHWKELSESKSFNGIPKFIRLPTEIEWIKVAGGNKPKNRFPWDQKGRTTRSLNEIKRYANLGKGGYFTTPVDKYPNGASQFGVMDLAGNAREWLANYNSESISPLGKERTFHFVVKGGWFKGSIKIANLAGRESFHPYVDWKITGFRLVLLPMM